MHVEPSIYRVWDQGAVFLCRWYFMYIDLTPGTNWHNNLKTALAWFGKLETGSRPNEYQNRILLEQWCLSALTDHTFDQYKPISWSHEIFKIRLFDIRTRGYTCIHVDLHAHTHICIYIYMKIYTRMCFCMYACVCICTHVHLHAHIHSITFLYFTSHYTTLH